VLGIIGAAVASWLLGLLGLTLTGWIGYLQRVPVIVVHSLHA
jgi:uncharacterized membrane protein YeaQ/YmgE (transglycosylase-associated protein family)